jgi:hypothetical protein
MQGLSVITHPNGQPKTAMIDLDQHDEQLNPLVAGLLQLLRQQDEDDERRDWRLLAHAGLNRAYGDEEPDYDDVQALTSETLTSHE